MRLFELFFYIVEHTGAGVSGSGLALLWFYIFSLAQMGAGLVQALRLYFQVFPGRSAEQKVLSSIIPVLLLTAAAIIEPLFFAMFTGGHFHQFDYLRGIFSDKQFYCEVLIVFLLYAAAAYIVHRLAASRKAAKPSLIGKLDYVISLLEIVFILLFGGLCLLALIFDRNGNTLWSQLLTRNDTAMLWMVYGIYMILYKTAVRFFAVVWSILFAPREIVLGGREPGEYGDSLIVKEIRQACSLRCKIALQYSILCVYLAITIKKDTGPQDLSFFLIFSLIMLTGSTICMLTSFIQWLFPRHTSRYKAFGGLNTYDISKYNEEYFGRKFTYENSNLWLTKTFLIHKKPFAVQPVRSLSPEQKEWIEHRQNKIEEKEM